MFRPITTENPIAVAALAIALLLPRPARAAELGCTVRTVQDATVTLACDGGATPHVGDAVTLGVDVPGVGFVALEGAWTVTLIGPGGEAQASPAPGAHGRPQIGNLARVETTAVASQPPAATDREGAPATAPADDDLPPIARAPRLGIRLAAGSEGEQGAKIEEVEPGGAAERAGLQPGDVILTFGHVPTPDNQTLVGEIRRRRAGETVAMRVLRFPSVLDLDATLQTPSLDDPDIQYLVGAAYLHGDGVPADPAKAELWIKRAAAGGSADAIAALNPQPSPADFFRGSPTARTDAGVFIVGSENGNRSVLFQVDPAIRQVLAGAGARAIPLPSDVPFPSGEAPKPAAVSRALAGRGWLLYLELKLKWAPIGFAKDHITVTCYDPAGNEQWSEESSNVFAESRDHSTQLLINKIAEKLVKRTGQACLRP